MQFGYDPGRFSGIEARGLDPERHHREGGFSGDSGPSEIRPWWYTRLGSDPRDPNSGGRPGLSAARFRPGLHFGVAADSAVIRALDGPGKSGEDGPYLR